MKMKNMIWGLLPMAAALMLTACSSNDIEDVAEKPATKTIPFTAKVSTENATRISAEEGSGTYTLKFTAGDRLYVYNTTGSDILEGFLDIDPADAGKTTATFTGNLTYTPGSSDPSTPADDLEICVTLVQEGGDPYNPDICSSVTEAIQTYSYLENIITYSQLSSFSFKQYTGVVDFDITLSGTNAPTAGTNVNIAVDATNSYSNPPSDVLLSYTGTATVTSDGKVKFALPLEASREGVYTVTLKDASVTISNASYQGTCSFADATGFTVNGKVYRAARTINTWAAAGHALTSAVVGEIIGSDGKAYAAADKDNLPSGVTAVAMVTYKGSATGETSFTNGLALALKDANNGSTCLWSTSTSSKVHTYYTDDKSKFSSISESGLQYNNSSFVPNHNTDDYPAFKAAMANNSTTAPTNCSAWFLPTCYQLQLMIDACKNVLGTNDNFTDLRDAFTGVGGENMKSEPYWLATEYEAYYAWRYLFNTGSWSGGSKNFDFYVRSAIAF